MKITYQPKGINNFHGSPAINLIITGETEIDSMSDSRKRIYIVSANQRKRVEKHFCGISDCHCSAGAVIDIDYAGEEFGIRKEWCEKA